MNTTTTKIATAMTDEQIIEMAKAHCVDATRISTVLSFARALLASKPAVPQYSKNIKWPQGYCLDPNGVMCTPPGMHEAWSFGYDLGYADALAIRSPTAPAQSCGDAEQAAVQQAKTAPFVMSLHDVVEMWNSVIADSFEDELIEFAAKAINFYKDSLPGSAAPNVAEQADEATTEDKAK